MAEKRVAPKVVILCGGRGTRFREETEARPKPMIEIGGRPILWHIMKIFAARGFTDFVLCLGYRGDVIKRYFLEYEALSNDITVTLGRGHAMQIHPAVRDDGPAWRVTLADTGAEAMTGARLARVRRYVDTPEWFMTYGDGVADVDPARLLAFHRRHGRAATVTGVRPASRFGELIVRGNRVTRFSEKPQVHEGFVNGGFFVLSQRVFDYLSEEDGCSFEREPLERLAADGELRLFRHGGFWQCMDTYRDWSVLEGIWRRGRAPWALWARARSAGKKAASGGRKGGA